MELDNSNYSSSFVSSFNQYLSHYLYCSDSSTEAARCLSDGALWLFKQCKMVCCSVWFSSGFFFLKWKSGGDGGVDSSSQQLQWGGDIGNYRLHMFEVLRTLLTIFNCWESQVPAEQELNTRARTAHFCQLLFWHSVVTRSPWGTRNGHHPAGFLSPGWQLALQGLTVALHRSCWCPAPKSPGALQAQDHRVMPAQPGTAPGCTGSITWAAQPPGKALYKCSAGDIGSVQVCVSGPKSCSLCVTVLWCCSPGWERQEAAVQSLIT